MTDHDSLELRLAESRDWPAWSRMWAEYLRFYRTELSNEQFEITWARIMNSDERMYCIVAVSGTSYPGFVNFLYHRSFWTTTTAVTCKTFLSNRLGGEMGSGRS